MQTSIEAQKLFFVLVIDIELEKIVRQLAVVDQVLRIEPLTIKDEARAKHLLRELDRGAALPRTYPYPVLAWQLGPDLTFVALGGEVVVDYALRLKQELGPGRTWIAGYTNDVMAYIPSLRVLKEGGYEGGGAMAYYGLPASWGPRVEELIVAAVHEQVKKVRGK